MKFYQILFIAFILQVFFTLPFQRTIISIDNSPTAGEAYKFLTSNGIGPVIAYPSGWATTDPNSTSYYAFYIGNTALNMVLLVCVYLLYKKRI